MFQHAIVCNQCRKIGEVYSPYQHEAAAKSRARLVASGWICNSPSDFCADCKDYLRSVAGKMNLLEQRKEA